MYVMLTGERDPAEFMRELTLHTDTVFMVRARKLQVEQTADRLHFG